MLARLADDNNDTLSIHAAVRLVMVLLVLIGIAPNITQAEPKAPQQLPRTAEVTTLELGTPYRREIGGSQKHVYQLPVTTGQYVEILVEQRGVDVVVRLIGPDDQAIIEVDSDSRPVGEEVLELVGSVTGNYKIEIQPRYKTLPSGLYEIQIVESRPATERDKSLDEARRLHALAHQEYVAAKYDDAIRDEERSLNIREKILGPDDLSVGQSLFNLGLYCRNAGDIPRAEESYLRALAIREKALGPDHPDVALVLHNLGYLYYYDVHDYDRAGSLYERSLAIKEKAFGADHPLVAMTLNNIGLLEWKKKDYARAERYFQRSLEIIEKNDGPESALVGTAAHSLGIVYKESGDYAKGERFYRRALQIWEKALGKDHPRTAIALESLGILYRDKGDYVNAEPLLLRAIEIEEKSEGANHPDVANTLVILARLYEAKGDIARAIELQTRAAAIEEKNIALNLTLGSERQKLAYFSSMTRQSERRISLHVRSAPGDPKARDLALTMILQRKGRVLDALADTLAALRRRSSPQDQALFDQLKTLTGQLAQLVLNGPDSPAAAAEHEKKIAALQQQREDLEEQVGRASSGLYRRSPPVALDAVRNALPDNASLIEFAMYHPSDPKVAVEHDVPTEPHYVAYVISKHGAAQWKELGPAREIDHEVTAFRQALRDPNRRDVTQLARALDEKLMRPVRALVNGATQLLLSPDGELNLVPFAALVDEQGQYLIQRYSITYLTSGRDLLRLQVGRQSQSGPVVVADPSFGEPALLTSRDASGRSGGVKNPVRIDYSQVFFGPLPGVSEEVRALRVLLPNASFLTHEEATKAALESVNAPSILHIATHGFFLSEPGEVAKEVPPGATRGVHADARIENPLLRSGLALAGANRKDESGILTALEASGLNLWGTRLVVLSACDTGVGEIRNGEGAYGLRRAFVLAGAETQLTSLWPVSDRTTHELMISYYTILLRGNGRGDSLREAQLQMLQSKSHNHPFYWASFIQTGEWANLEGKR